MRTGERKTLLRGGYFGRYLPSGHLVYMHQGLLFGVAFDAARLGVRSTPVPLEEGVTSNPNQGGGQFDFSAALSGAGTLVYLAGKGTSRTWPVVWLDNSGQTQTLVATPGIYTSPRLSPDGQRLALNDKKDIFIYDLRRSAMARLTVDGRSGFAVWLPDGSHVAFRSFFGDINNISWIRADGAGETQRLASVCRFGFVQVGFSSCGFRVADSPAHSTGTT